MTGVDRPPRDLAGSRHRLDLRVYYEDTDAAGIVYYANYLRFAERGRSEWLRSLGFDHRRLRDEAGVGFAVRRCTIDYLVAARLDDALSVETVLCAAGGATLTVRQAICRDDCPLARLDVVVACIGGDGRPRRLPAGLRAVLDHAAIPPAGRGKTVSLPSLATIIQKTP